MCLHVRLFICGNTHGGYFQCMKLPWDLWEVNGNVIYKFGASSSNVVLQSTMSKKKKNISVKEKYSVMLLWTNNADFFYVLTQGEQILSGSIGRLQFTLWSCSSYKTEHLFQKIHFFTSCLQITSKELLLHSVCAPIYGYSLKKNFSDRTLKHRKAGAS